MEQQYPLEFTLEDGTQVLVNKTGTHTFEFTLETEDTPVRHFTYIQDQRSKSEVEEGLDFGELDVLRRFWLETEDIL
ncbi:hypothetical protein [Rubrolithibacter danxiaensis]|uniref:hypothetical protein n=1 Tax=Rubrolithibacter danxiaensis TaxID=3390805 RepID=UPI003BF863E3